MKTTMTQQEFHDFHNQLHFFKTFDYLDLIHKVQQHGHLPIMQRWMKPILIAIRTQLPEPCLCDRAEMEQLIDFAEEWGDSRLQNDVEQYREYLLDLNYSRSLRGY